MPGGIANFACGKIASLYCLIISCLDNKPLSLFIPFRMHSWSNREKRQSTVRFIRVATEVYSAAARLSKE